MFRYAVSIAALTFAALPAVAQTSSPNGTGVAPGQRPATTQPSTAPTAPPANSTVSPSAAQWYSIQADDMRASRLMGSTVRNNAGESVGDVNEVIIDKSGKVAAVIVGVGGFLGIGEREVALSYNQIQSRVDGSGNLVVTTNVSRDQLKSAPAIQKSTTR